MKNNTNKTLFFVKETRFGDWFINTKMWKLNVINRALNDLIRLLPDNQPQFDCILDIGCGFGHSFQSLYNKFQPTKIIGLDADPDILERAGKAADNATPQVALINNHAADMHSIADGAVDMVFCHQSFHHIVEQEHAIKEFYRVLKPGGVLLFAESTKRYINTLQIRLFFRHPMSVQKTAQEYLALIRSAGFQVNDEQVSLPFLWWSRPDCGMLEWLGFSVPKQREETLVNTIAMKPGSN